MSTNKKYFLYVVMCKKERWASQCDKLNADAQKQSSNEEAKMLGIEVESASTIIALLCKQRRFWGGCSDEPSLIANQKV